MANLQKYFVLLENLKLANNLKGTSEIINQNIELLKKYTGIQCVQLNNQPSLKRILCAVREDSSHPGWVYSTYLYYVLLTLKDNINLDSDLKEDLISIRHFNYMLSFLASATHIGITLHLHPAMRDNPIFSSLEGTAKPDDVFSNLRTTLRFLKEFLSIKSIASHSLIDSVVLEAMAGIFNILSMEDNSIKDGTILKQEKDESLQFLHFIWEHTNQDKYFKNLLILKSIKSLPTHLHNILHKDLLDKLQKPCGFGLLVRNLIGTQMTVSENTPSWKRYEIVARIVTHKGHPFEFYVSMIKHIFEFIMTCISGSEDKNLIPAGVVTLRALYMNDIRLKKEILNKISMMFEDLIHPHDILTGIIIMDPIQFKEFVDFLYNSFCVPSMESLPSDILVEYLSVLLNLYDHLLEDMFEKNQLKRIIVQCLANRKRTELDSILENLLMKDETKDDLNMKKINPRVILNINKKFNNVQIQISSEGQENSFEMFSALVSLLKTSNNNILIYHSFLSILKLLLKESNDNENQINIDLVSDQEEFDNIILKKYKDRLSILSCLTNLIMYRNFHSQFHDNPSELLDFVQSLLENRTKFLEKSKSSNEFDNNLLIVLTILQQLIESSNDTSKFSKICNFLKEFSTQIKEEILQHQIRTLIELIEFGGPSTTADFGISEYNFAKSHIEESQSHLRVYGITQFIKLIKNRDMETLANSNTILAITLRALRDEESYTYLNCIRLLVQLTDILQSEVLEALSSEYLNENEPLEMRLKVGEAILKVSEELGPICYKFKDILINNFMHGCKNSLEEFRTSSLSNLGTICRILTYQVGNFFEELITLINSFIETEKYLPARRAAVRVLEQLIKGIDNLIDSQDILLPTFKLLKYVVEYDQDERTRIHATNGLTYLNEKCKEFLFPEQKLQKEIKIFGINSEDKKKKNSHILELN